MLMQQSVYSNSKISNITQSVTYALTFDAANQLVNVQADAPFPPPAQTPTATLTPQGRIARYYYDGDGHGLPALERPGDSWMHTLAVCAPWCISKGANLARGIRPAVGALHLG
ncbi:MAG: hypothetical protein ABFC97_02480 [Anaerolineaceae bacterium]